MSIVRQYISRLEYNTVGENIIATIKMRKNYGAIQSFLFSILQYRQFSFFLALKGDSEKITITFR